MTSQGTNKNTLLLVLSNDRVNICENIRQRVMKSFSLLIKITKITKKIELRKKLIKIVKSPKNCHDQRSLKIILLLKILLI